MYRNDVSRGFALLIGAFLLIEGVCELFSPVVFGIFSSNATHGVIHILLGVVGILSALISQARVFCAFLGGLLLLVGILWFLPHANDLIVTTLNVNRAVACVNLFLGTLALMAAFARSTVARAEI